MLERFKNSNFQDQLLNTIKFETLTTIFDVFIWKWYEGTALWSPRPFRSFLAHFEAFILIGESQLFKLLFLFSF